MPEAAELLLLVGIGLLAGVINVMAGGGSTLTLPILIFLGLDPSVANGTNRVAIVAQNVIATGSFRRHGVSRLLESTTYALWTVPGAVIGSVVAVRIDDEWFELILGAVMIFVVISMAVPRRGGETTLEGMQSKWIGPALFAIGFYGGFIQVGVGFLLMAAFYHLLRMNLVRVNVHKVVIVLVYTLPALLIFALSGNVSWRYGLCLAAGNSAGAWWAARTMIQTGESVVRWVLIVAVLIMAAKLLRLF